MSRPELRAVLFDMDGTLVETEEYWGEAMFALAARLGGRMSAEARARTVGSSMAVSMGILYADLGVVRTPEEQAEDIAGIESAVADMMARSVRWQPGARELLAAVRAAGLRTALVTTTGRAVADLVIAHVVAAFDGESPFDLTVCGDEVPARKPDPAPYLQAMAALGVRPGECVVVEDSLTGVTSGLTAGAAVLGVAGMQQVPPAPGLTQVESLVGLAVDDLAAALNGRAPAGSPAS
ncbi:HAD family phosphatase [Blastococcus sp. TF02A-30]|uniref:HAD family hydrolase n=1 Tax=Blastococcus sp. TF02A-30 TaxID=2250580 RepID=UPI000DE99FE6|nr:HAD family phosphatase [Blastococcus sp. TF02A-30]RBY87661.1 HAD family phosphatase [Blastococcus sp. TF02A-30]